MSRIGSLAANTSLISQMLRVQERIFDLETQATSEKRSQDYAGISTDSQRLLNLENTKDQLEQFKSNNSQSEIRLDIMSTAVEGIRTSLREFQKELTTYETGATKDETKVNAVQDAALRALRDVEDLLNIDIDGRFLFAGARINTEPVEFSAPSVAVFQAKFDGAAVTVPTARNAALETFSFNNDQNSENKQFIDDSKFLQFRQGTYFGTTAGSTTVFNNAANTIQVQNSSTGAAVANVFKGLKVGDTVTVAGAPTAGNNQTVTINSISSDFSQITVAEALVTENDTDGVVFNGVANASAISSITASSAIYANVEVGSAITVSGAANSANNGTFTVDSVVNGGRTINITTEMLNTEAAQPATLTYRDPTNVNNEITISTVAVGSLGFTRGTNTINAALANSLTGVPVNAKITIAGSGNNDGNYTVVSNDNTNIVVKSNKLTDEGLTSGDTFFSYTSGTRLEFNGAEGTNSVAVRNNGDSAFIDRVFNGLSAGDQVTLASTPVAGNNTTFTVSATGTNGRSLTTTATVAASADDTDGASATGVANTGSNGFAYEAGTIMAADTAANTITIRNAGDTANVTGVFSNLQVGMNIEIASHAGLASPTTATITGITNGGATLQLAALAGAGGNDTNGATVNVYSADGTVKSETYYKGDQLSLTQRVSDRREFEFNVTGADPAFEKAIRGLQIILQGVYGTEGGLDNNPDRIATAKFLVESGLERTVTTNANFASELIGSIEQVQQNVGFNQVLLDRTNDLHTDFIGFLDTSIDKVENINELEVITRLLDDARALESSFQAFARIRQLSLTNFI